MRFVSRLGGLVIIAGLAGALSAPATQAAPAMQAAPAQAGQGPQAPAAIILAQPGEAYLQLALATNTSGHITLLEHPSLNSNSTAKMLVTQQLTSEGTPSASDDHPVGVYYNGIRWTIYNDDLQGIPVGTPWNVFIPPATPRSLCIRLIT